MLLLAKVGGPTATDSLARHEDVLGVLGPSALVLASRFVQMRSCHRGDRRAGGVEAVPCICIFPIVETFPFNISRPAPQVHGITSF